MQRRAEIDLCENIPKVSDLPSMRAKDIQLHAQNAAKAISQARFELEESAPKHKFVRVETKPYGPGVRNVDIYPADENGMPASTFSMCNVVHIDGRATICGVGESIDDVERRALAMLEAVAVARELESKQNAKG